MSTIRFCPNSYDYEITWPFAGFSVSAEIHQSVPTALLRQLADMIDAHREPPKTKPAKKPRAKGKRL